MRAACPHRIDPSCGRSVPAVSMSSTITAVLPRTSPPGGCHQLADREAGADWRSRRVTLSCAARCRDMSPRVLAIILVTLAVPTAAHAEGSRWSPVDVPATDLADAAGAVAPSAARGHVVFSRLMPGTEHYELVEWTAERGLRVLPVGERAVPFDADVGPGATSGAVVSYSRCAKDGTLSYILPTVDFSRARGCRPYVLDLRRADARPRPLRLAGATGLSLTTPSVRGGSVAAVAAPARGTTSARVLRWRRMTQAPVRLRGGSPPKCSYASCRTAPRTSVDALDLGPRSVAFLWRLSDPPYGAGQGVELRSSSLRPGGPGRQVSSAQGYVSGACGFRQPLSPSAGGGGGVSFLLAQSPCEELQTSLARQRVGVKSILGTRPAGALVYGAAFEASRVFWLRGAPPVPDASEGSDDDIPVPCATTGTACRLVVSRSLPPSGAAGR